MARLIVEYAGVSKTYNLTEEAMILGRLKTSGIPIREENVSREHCRIEKRGDQYVIRDLGSRNGTVINGHKVVEHVLAHGDSIRIGRASLRFHDPGAAPPVAAAAPAPPSDVAAGETSESGDMLPILQPESEVIMAEPAPASPAEKSHLGVYLLVGGLVAAALLLTLGYYLLGSGRGEREKLLEAAKQAHEEAVSLFEEGDYAEAKAAFEEALGKVGAGLITLGYYLLGSGRGEREKLLEAAKQAHEEAVSLFEEGDYAEAKAAFEEALGKVGAGLKLDPKNSALKRMQGEIEDALARDEIKNVGEETGPTGEDREDADEDADEDTDDDTAPAIPPPDLPGRDIPEPEPKPPVPADAPKALEEAPGIPEEEFEAKPIKDKRGDKQPDVDLSRLVSAGRPARREAAVELEERPPNVPLVHLLFDKLTETPFERRDGLRRVLSAQIPKLGGDNDAVRSYFAEKAGSPDADVRFYAYLGVLSSSPAADIKAVAILSRALEDPSDRVVSLALGHFHDRVPPNLIPADQVAQVHTRYKVKGPQQDRYGLGEYAMAVRQKCAE